MRKNGEGFIAIRFDALPTLRLLGSEPDAEGNFSLVSLEFLCPNLSGWNEFSRELSGRGVFRVNAAGTGEAVLRLDGEVEALDITAGKIRRNSSRITGDQAISALRNRQERISALAEWMKVRGDEKDNGGYARQDEFEKYWNPILFPELATAKARPPEWTVEGAAWVRGEDVMWNTVYTGGLFPEELLSVRNSGTMLRDWEEAAAWIYLQYEWERIMESLTHAISLIKIK
ncbi:MAG: hypothetical protein LBP81_09120, partial [Treponema sp.]|jgi:predicted transcriptional regulator|nr:hypothetical protein [Treponema sp.]